MPEYYIEPVTNRQECYTCHKVVTGKKKLSKCKSCHTITYCSKECQRADWPRHSWNCVPVMITEIPGKGRGLVAARDIKMGEQIFIDNPVIKIYTDVEKLFDNINIDLVKKQVDELPSEAKILFNNLEGPGMIENAFLFWDVNLNGGKVSTFQKFLKHSKRSRVFDGGLEYFYMSLNHCLINHSCAPNVAVMSLQPDDECRVEVRATKDITKGEEITRCYLRGIDFWRVGFDAQERKREIHDQFSFECKCSVCSGIVPGQEDIMMALRALYGAIDIKIHDKKKADWTKDAETMGNIVELNKTRYVGDVVLSKAAAISDLVKMAHLARDKGLLKNALNKYSKFVEDTKLEEIRCDYEKLEEDLAKWTAQLKLKKNPKKEEMDFFFKMKD